MPEVSCASGKIIRRSSVHDVMPRAGRAHYAASKAEVVMLMKTIALTWIMPTARPSILATVTKPFLKIPSPLGSG